MFEPVKDVMQIKALERRLGRPLTPNELEQLEYEGSIIIEWPDGSVSEEYIQTYSLNELIPSPVNAEDIEATALLKQSKADRKAAKALPKVKPDQRFECSPQIFTEKPESQAYFQKITMALDSISDEKTRTICAMHTQGRTVREIAEALKGTEFSVSKATVERKLTKALKEMGVEKIFTKKEANL